jgi:hypothetical protein
MDSFSEAFDAAKAALAAGDLDGDFKKLQKSLKRLLGPSGPDIAEKALLGDLRDKIASGAKSLVAKGGAAPSASAKVIVAGAGSGKGKVERAATLKMLKHLYHQKSAGGQQIWVYAPPSGYSEWIFDEVAGANEPALVAVLSKNEPEVYSESQRGTMAQAVQQARAVAQAVAAKLGAASDTTKAVVRRYFGNASTTEKQLIEIMTTLATGYLRIAGACNEGNIVISDEPTDRTGGGWKDWAFIYTEETMSVIYLQGAWLQKADEVTPSNQSPIYRCVRTVIHELSHKEVGTEDIVYGPKGLKPEGSTALTPEYALHNADSWAYFAVDVLGYLTGPDKTNGDTPTSAIRQTPTGTLKV